MANVLDYIKSLNDDLLEQFRGQPNTEVLIRALARQLQEVADFFADLRDKRSLELAEGKQLDGIGDIVQLSRMQAGLLAGQKYPESTLDDTLYSQYLAYKVFLNTNTCTYADVHKALRMFWKAAPLRYEEKPEHPATMFFNTSLLDKVNYAVQVQFPVIKPAGVALVLTAMLPLSQFENSEAFYLRSLQLLMRFYNYAILLDGGKLLDGSWLLQAIMGFQMPRFTVAATFITQSRLGGSIALVYAFRTLQSRIALEAFGALMRIENEQNLYFQPEGFQADLKARQSYQFGNGCLIQDSLYELDGSVILDGSRKLNAQIVKGEI